MQKNLHISKKSSTFAAAFGKKPNARGVLAHLVERNNGIVEVRSSSLLCSTKKRTCPSDGFVFFLRKNSQVHGIIYYMYIIGTGMMREWLDKPR